MIIWWIFYRTQFMEGQRLQTHAPSELMDICCYWALHFCQHFSSAALRQFQHPSALRIWFLSLPKWTGIPPKMFIHFDIQALQPGLTLPAPGKHLYIASLNYNTSPHQTKPSSYEYSFIKVFHFQILVRSEAYHPLHLFVAEYGCLTVLSLLKY